MNSVKRSLVASIIFATFVSTIFAGCYHDRDDDWRYHRYSRDYSYDRDRYDRDRYYNRDPYYDRDDDRDLAQGQVRSLE